MLMLFSFSWVWELHVCVSKRMWEWVNMRDMVGGVDERHMCLCFSNMSLPGKLKVQQDLIYSFPVSSASQLCAKQRHGTRGSGFSSVELYLSSSSSSPSLSISHSFSLSLVLYLFTRPQRMCTKQSFVCQAVFSLRCTPHSVYLQAG